MPVPPKPDAIRRNKPKPTTKLPAEGRKGRAPKWPLDDPSPAERDLWRELWSTPQSVMWERHGWFRAVARYARVTIAAERVDAPPPTLAEARQLEDRLGLSPLSMLRLQWEIVADEVAGRRSSRPVDKPGPRRIRAV